MDDNEGKITPIKVANALIEALDACKDFPENGLKEITAYLSVYNRYAEGRKK
jgi:inorganic pyrophosphatase